MANPTATRFEELIAWQRSSEFLKWAYDVSETGPMVRDLRFRTQWRDAACSAPRNLAEGFVKFEPPEFARFTNIAKGSLAELQNHLRQGQALGYFTDEQFTHGWRLLGRAFRATSRLHAYLRSCGRKSHGPHRSD